MTYLVGIAGGTGSGKGTIAELIEKYLTEWGLKTFVLSSDDCYKDYSYLSVQERDGMCFNPDLNFDHPKSVHFERLIAYAKQIKEGKSFEIPRYDFKTHSYGNTTINVPEHLDVGIIEGIYTLYSGEEIEKSLLSLYDFKVFVVTTPEIAMARRMRRDIAERGREVQHVLDQLNKTVIPMHKKFVYPTQYNADDIINWSVDETQSSDEIREGLLRIAKQKAFSIYEAVKEPVLKNLDLGMLKIPGI